MIILWCERRRTIPAGLLFNDHSSFTSQWCTQQYHTIAKARSFIIWPTLKEVKTFALHSIKCRKARDFWGSYFLFLAFDDAYHVSCVDFGEPFVLLCCFEWDGWRAGDGSGSPPIQKRKRFEFESHQFGPDGIIWTHLNIQRSTHMQCNTIPNVESTSRFDGKWEVIQNKIGGLFKFYAKEFFTFMRKRETQICV